MQKVIARAGLASRREAERWIQAGRVTVNGRKVTELGTQVDPTNDRIAIDGKLLSRRQPAAYYALWKPKGVITSTSDPEGRRDLGEWLRPLKKIGRLFPVGRLDFRSEGLLLLTTDGELAHRLQHPRYGVVKRYRVKVGGVPAEGELERLRRGIELEDGRTAPAVARVVRATERKAWLEIEIHEGRKRQVRRMFEALGHSVEKLVRVAYGPVELRGLSPGEMRPLSAREVELLKQAVGMARPPSGGQARPPRDSGGR